MINRGVNIEIAGAKRDVQCIAHEYGAPLEVKIRTETDVERDEYGSIKEYETTRSIIVYGYPIVYNPSEKTIERFGLRQVSEIIVTTPKKDWDDQGIEFGDLDITRATVILGSESFFINQVTQSDAIADTYLSAVIGLKRK